MGEAAYGQSKGGIEGIMTQEQYMRKKVKLNIKLVQAMEDVKKLRRELRRLEKEKAAPGLPSWCGKVKSMMLCDDSRLL